MFRSLNPLTIFSWFWTVNDRCAPAPVCQFWFMFTFASILIVFVFYLAFILFSSLLLLYRHRILLPIEIAKWYRVIHGCFAYISTFLTFSFILSFCNCSKSCRFHFHFMCSLPFLILSLLRNGVQSWVFAFYAWYQGNCAGAHFSPTTTTAAVSAKREREKTHK